MWNQRDPHSRGTLAPKAPFYIGGAILLVAAVILAFALLGGSSDEKQPSILAQPTAALDQPPAAAGQPAAGAAGDPLPAVTAHVLTTLAKPLLDDCARADAARDAGKLCASAKGEREGRRAYQILTVGGAPAMWVIMENQGGQWRVANSVTVTPDNAGVTGVPWPLRTGVELVVVGANPCLNVREGPSLAQRAVDCLRDGTRVTLTAGPANADNIIWWQVAGRAGWVSADYLRYPDAAQ